MEGWRDRPVFDREREEFHPIDLAKIVFLKQSQLVRLDGSQRRDEYINPALPQEPHVIPEPIPSSRTGRNRQTDSFGSYPKRVHKTSGPHMPRCLLHCPCPRFPRSKVAPARQCGWLSCFSFCSALSRIPLRKSSGSVVSCASRSSAFCAFCRAKSFWPSAR
jgi:hypothetical protein